MEVISFTGRSGTGKSYKANSVAADNNCDAIIDDGLLIYKGQIVAGSSAKKCESKAAAMRTALFDLEANRKAVQQGLIKYHPEKLMVLGTSDRMADWICDALGIKHASQRIHIEDVSTEEEREIASKSRNIDGEHVIPAPMLQLKRDFAGYFINPLRLYNAAIDNNPDVSLSDVAAAAKQVAFGSNEGNATIVRPKYNANGSFKISEQVIRDIVSIVVKKHDSLIALVEQLRQGKESGLTIHLDVCILDDPESINELVEIQKEIKEAIESMTSFTVNHVNLRISDIVG